MRNPYSVSIESVDNSKATKVGFLLLAASIVLYLFDKNTFANTNPFNLTLAQTLVSWALLVATIIVRIVVVVWVSNIAAGLNRGILSWAIFALAFPSICLIVIGFLDEKAGDEALQKIVDKCRANYAIEKYVLTKSEQPKNELKEQLKELKRRHTELLQSKVKEFYAEEEKWQMAKVEFIEVAETDLASGKVSKRKAVKIDGVTYSTDKCPACGHRITEDMEACPDCEIALK